MRFKLSKIDTKTMQILKHGHATLSSSTLYSVENVCLDYTVFTRRKSYM